MTRNAVYRSLNTPLTLLGIERRLFFAVTIVPVVLFQITNALVPALVLFLAFLLIARAMTASDPQMLRILLNSARTAARYDPGKAAHTTSRSSVRLDSLFRPYDESRPFWSVLNVFGFFRHRLMSKGGDVAAVIRIRGTDAECATPEDREATVSRIRSAFLTFDPHFRTQQYLFKRSNPEVSSAMTGDEVVDEALRNRDEFLRSRGSERFSYETYLVVIRMTNWKSLSLAQRLRLFIRHPLKVFGHAFRSTSQIASLGETLDETATSLDKAVQSFIEQTADLLQTEVLNEEEAFQFLRRLVNPCRKKAAAVKLTADVHVDYFAADSVLECHPGYLKLDDYFLKPHTLKRPPSSTYADMLRNLLRIPGEMIVVLDWTILDDDKAASLIRSKKRHFHNVKSSMWAGLFSERPPNDREILYDESKEALALDLGKLLVAKELEGRRIGLLTWTAIPIAKSLEAMEEASSAIQRVIGAADGAVNTERHNVLNAFLAALPVGFPFNLRQLLVTDQNHADLGFWFLPSEGERWNSYLSAESLLTFETEDNSLYHFNAHTIGLGHVKCIGPSGRGKSFVLNALFTHAQKYRPITIIFDYGGSFRSITRLFKGTYIELNAERLPFSINPFACEPTKANLDALDTFVRYLIEHNGPKINDGEGKDLYTSIESLFVLPSEQRRLLTLSTTVCRSLAERLKPWTEGEQYGRLFDNVEDNLTFAQFQCFDLEGLHRSPVEREALLFYLVTRADKVVCDPSRLATLKILGLDEADKYLKHAITRNYLVDAIRRYRKKNAVVFFATQSLEDLSEASDLRPLIENCPTTLLFPNPKLNAQLHRDALGMTDTEIEHVRQLVPRRQFLLKRDGFSKVLNLNVDPRSQWLYTTDPLEVDRRQKAIEEHGSLRAALDFLTGVHK
jgi:type IV secretion system protein TrbE